MDKDVQAFFALVKAGLWEQEARLSPYGEIDFKEIYRLAEEQSVTGLVAAGLEHIVDLKAPKTVVLEFVGVTIQLEQHNKAMNEFIGNLINKLRAEDIYALLVKGQGIAQCYERPLWRACGDVDLLLSDCNYQKAKGLLRPLASSVDEENIYYQHLSMTIDDWVVELHGTLRGGLWKRLDKTIDKAQSDIFYGGNVRSWQNGRTQVFLPGINEDVVFVFAHILQHFFKEGIGLRQLCDWCRLMWKYRDCIDGKKLEQQIRDMGVMSEWRVFATFSVQYLGMPESAMPMFGSSIHEYKVKASRVMEFVMETGNFGHNRDYSYYEKYPYLVYKAISLWRHITDTFKYFFVFPLDSIRVICGKILEGVNVLAKLQ